MQGVFCLAGEGAIAVCGAERASPAALEPPSAATLLLSAPDSGALKTTDMAEETQPRQGAALTATSAAHGLLAAPLGPAACPPRPTGPELPPAPAMLPLPRAAAGAGAGNPVRRSGPGRGGSGRKRRVVVTPSMVQYPSALEEKSSSMFP